MKNNRIKVTLPLITTRDEAESVMNDLALTVNNQRKMLADRDAELLAVMNAYAPDLAACERDIKLHTDALRAWAEYHPEQFPKDRKSLALAAGTLGFRTGTPKLALISRAWSWDKVRDAIKRVFPSHIRTKEEVDKDALLELHSQTDNRPGLEAMFKANGIKVVQDESFFVDPKLTDQEARQTVEAK